MMAKSTSFHMEVDEPGLTTEDEGDQYDAETGGFEDGVLDSTEGEEAEASISPHIPDPPASSTDDEREKRRRRRAELIERAKYLIKKAEEDDEAERRDSLRSSHSGNGSSSIIKDVSMTNQLGVNTVNVDQNPSSNPSANLSGVGGGAY